MWHRHSCLCGEVHDGCGTGILACAFDPSEPRAEAQMRTTKSLLAIILAITMASPLFGQAMVPLPKPSGSNFFSPQQDIELGKQNVAEVRKQMPMVPDS